MISLNGGLFRSRVGSKLQKVLGLGHEKLSVYGIGAHHSKEAWSYIFHHMLAARLLQTDAHGALKITDEGTTFVKGISSSTLVFSDT
jgi:ATP-dependent DNA helicase RecQ